VRPNASTSSMESVCVGESVCPGMERERECVKIVVTHYIEKESVLEYTHTSRGEKACVRMYAQVP